MVTVADSISVRHFGDTEVAVVSAGELSGWVPYFESDQTWATAQDEIAADGSVTAGVNWMLIRRDDTVVLVDPASFHPGQVIGRAKLAAGPPIEAVLVELGVSAEAVTHVVVSHFHADHLAGLVATGSDAPRFPNAIHVVPARDWQHYVVEDAAGDADELMQQLGPPARAGLLRQVDADTVLVDGISVLDTPGESPGHLSVRVQAGGTELYYLGDLVHFPVEFEHIDWLAVRDRAREQLVASRTKLLEEAIAGAIFVFTHGRFPAWGTIEPIGAASWRWSYGW